MALLLFADDFLCPHELLADGSMVCMSKVLDMYRARFFEIDFRPIIEQVIDLHEQYNQVIRFQNPEIFIEEVQN